MVVRDPPLITRVRSQRPDLLVTFAGAGNTAGTRILLNFGFDIAAPTKGGDTALHAAAWRERRATVEALLSRGAPRDARNHRGETPLDVARRAQVEYSEFTPHSSPAIVELLSR
jgi:hypothetical protein